MCSKAATASKTFGGLGLLFEAAADGPERVDYRITQEPDRWVQSACLLCSNGCALDIGVKDGRIVGVRGRAVDSVNKERLGPKGLNGKRTTRPTAVSNHYTPCGTRFAHPL
jgi:ferredoxin-nitrate reductase